MKERDDIHAVFFDAGYTLLCMEPPQAAIFLRACDSLGIAVDREKLADAVMRANVMLGPKEATPLPVPFSQARVDAFWIEYHRRVLDACATGSGGSTRAESVYRRFTESLGWRVYDEVPALLDALHDRGVKTGIISNWTGDLEDVLRRVDLHRRFDVIVDSARFGHEKPHGAIFAEAAARAGVAPGCAVHVGDSVEHDVDGALAAGMRAVLVDRDGRHAAFARSPRVTDLTQILTLL